jgi:hypothetical protein
LKIIINGGGPLAFYLGAKLISQGFSVSHQCKIERNNGFFRSREIIKLRKVDLGITRHTYYPEAPEEPISEEIIKCIHFYVMTPESYAQFQKQGCQLIPDRNKRILISSFLATNPLHSQILRSESCCFLNIACDWSRNQLICIDNNSYISNKNFRNSNLSKDIPIMGESEELNNLETSCTLNFIRTTLSYAYLIQRKHRTNHVEALNRMKNLVDKFGDIEFLNISCLLDKLYESSQKSHYSSEGLLLSYLFARSDHAMAYFLRSLLESDLIQDVPEAMSEVSCLLKQCKNKTYGKLTRG